MRSSSWARITGADKNKQFPEQQATSMGRVGDFAMVNPYGLYCDLPSNSLIRVLGNGAAMPCTVDRPDGLAQGEPVFYHPVNNAKIIAKNDGSFLIESSKGSQPIVINCTEANINASDAVNIISPLTKVTGSLEVTGNTSLGATVTSNGKDISDSHKHTGSGTAPSGPVSDTGVVA